MPEKRGMCTPTQAHEPEHEATDDRRYPFAKYLKTSLCFPAILTVVATCVTVALTLWRPEDSVRLQLEHRPSDHLIDRHFTRFTISEPTTPFMSGLTGFKVRGGTLVLSNIHSLEVRSKSEASSAVILSQPRAAALRIIPSEEAAPHWTELPGSFDFSQQRLSSLYLELVAGTTVQVTHDHPCILEWELSCTDCKKSPFLSSADPLVGPFEVSTSGVTELEIQNTKDEKYEALKGTDSFSGLIIQGAGDPRGVIRITSTTSPTILTSFYGNWMPKYDQQTWEGLYLSLCSYVSRFESQPHAALLAVAGQSRELTAVDDLVLDLNPAVGEWECGNLRIDADPADSDVLRFTVSGVARDVRVQGHSLLQTAWQRYLPGGLGVAMAAWLSAILSWVWALMSKETQSQAKG